MRWPLFLAGVLILVLGVMQCTRARGAEDRDPSYGPFFKSLQQPGSGVSCCDLSDCRFTDSRVTPAGWEARVSDDQWVAVPNDKIIRGKANPNGRAVLCHIGGNVLCFVEPTGV